MKSRHVHLLMKKVMWHLPNALWFSCTKHLFLEDRRIKRRSTRNTKLWNKKPCQTRNSYFVTLKTVYRKRNRHVIVSYEVFYSVINKRHFTMTLTKPFLDQRDQLQPNETRNEGSSQFLEFQKLLYKLEEYNAFTRNFIRQIWLSDWSRIRLGTCR